MLAGDEESRGSRSVAKRVDEHHGPALRSTAAAWSGSRSGSMGASEVLRRHLAGRVGQQIVKKDSQDLSDHPKMQTPRLLMAWARNGAGPSRARRLGRTLNCRPALREWRVEISECRGNLSHLALTFESSTRAEKYNQAIQKLILQWKVHMNMAVVVPSTWKR